MIDFTFYNGIRKSIILDFHMYVWLSVYLSLCQCFFVSDVCMLTVPSQPEDTEYVSSTESTMHLLWKQTGVVDDYIVTYNNTETVSFTVFNDNTAGTMLTVVDLPTSGAYYCISVTAVSGHLHSHRAMLCNYTGDTMDCFLQCHFVMMHVQWTRVSTSCQQPMFFCLFPSGFC